MSKLVIIIGLVLAFFIIKHLINRGSGSKTAKDQNKNGDPQHLEYKDTVKCEYCGTHIPLADAYLQDKKHYCSEEHYNKITK